MKTGISLSQLAAKIEGDKALKHDLIAPTKAMTARTDADGTVSMEVDGKGLFPILPTAHDQIGSRLQVPGRYYDRMLKEAPELLTANLNVWLARSSERRMVRTLGGDMRAFLSDRYQRIENEEIAETVLPILADIPDVRIVSCEVTERRLYISALAPRIEGEVKKGDVVQAGITISNSEIGYGAVSVKPLIYRLVCLNGMTIPDAKFTARHVGRQISESEDLNAIYADDTRQADDRAVLLKVRDVVRAAVDETRFKERVERMSDLTTIRATGNPADAVEVLAKKVGVTESEKGGILRSLIEGGDLSAWGFLNAVTHQAHSASTYDRSMELIEVGGQLLQMPAREWQSIIDTGPLKIAA